MKSVLSILVVLVASVSFSQEPMYIDRNGDPINRKIPHLEAYDKALSCCCDFSWMTTTTTPPTTAANAKRFQLTADSLFINSFTVNSQFVDSVFYQLNQRKGSWMRFTYQPNTMTYAEVEIEAGSGVDMGIWWKFAINYLDYPSGVMANDKSVCVSWGYGTTNITTEAKVYHALLSQTGTSDPTVTILENSVGNITWTRTAAGHYEATCPNCFTSNKTQLVFSPVLQEWAGTIAADPTLFTSSSLNLHTFSSGSDSDDELMLTPVIIYVYP